MSRYQELKCERCKNRLARLKSKQGLFCEQMIKGNEPSCPKFNLDTRVAYIWN